MDNDDLDVTKNCEIVVTISDKVDDLRLNVTPHNAQVCVQGSNKLSIYAGLGVGVVTKKGLKITPDFPAINPTPLNAMFDIFKKLSLDYENLDLHCSVSITDGENISKQTANSKVGVVGGLSILGTTGIVKPVSSSAYIDSVRTEIEFAKENEFNPLIFTLGNSAFRVSKESYDEAQIVEVANFVYDSIEIATQKEIKKVIFVCGIGKMTKVYQGFKNTHNRFGTIDFVQLKEDIKNEIGYEVDIESTLTVKGISQELEKIGLVNDLYTMIAKKANEQIKVWFPTSNVEALILEQSEVTGW
ncbi:Cobalt-precorrin-5B C(1)-methyltransferase CbiD like protein [Aduncisulcus paluster]|uniref:Cobalt-precorrin-5B C(1)-methyltransferase CbiD like protein n=1 Tax=Aduncisulcus paluster TaxID=2918883 RepID=A0ABQ5KDF5_9EUKA|nr:Cobalt-precorrin-5B C(1)-methyltransferase CbiD like protein [Aduncisulcus paluster]